LFFFVRRTHNMSYRDRGGSRDRDSRDFDRDRGGYGGGRGRDRSPRSPRGRGGRGGSESDKRESTCLFVGNLPFHFRERDVADYFERCGRTRNITVGYNRKTNQSKGYAFVEFEDRRDAEDAFDRFQGYEMEGRRLRIDWDAGLDRKVATGYNRPRRSPGRRGSPRRYRSPSPRGRTPSPRRRSASPRRRSPSPRRRSPSPRRSHSPSPVAAARVSPNRSPSPGSGLRKSPVGEQGSPKRSSRSPSPKE